VKKAGPYGQFLRLRRICAKEEDFTRECDQMTSHYSNRGYPVDVVQTSRDQAAKISHHRAVRGFTNTPDNTEKPSVFVTTYNQNGPHMRDIITKHWDILQRSAISRLAFTEPPLVAKRRNPNLKDILVRAKIQYPPIDRGRQGVEVANLIEPCPKDNCKTCSALP
jgi:hypothetical protein